MSKESKSTFNVMFDSITELEQLAFYISCACNNLNAIQTAMSSDNNTAESFVDGLYACFITMDGYSKELTAAVERAYVAAVGKCDGQAD